MKSFCNSLAKNRPAASMKLHRFSFTEEFLCPLMNIHNPPPIILELSAAASMEVDHSTLMVEHPAPVSAASMEKLPSPTSIEDLPAAASMEVHHPTLMEEHPASVPAASMEELPAAASMKVHCPTLVEEHPATVTAASREELPPAAAAVSIQELPAVDGPSIMEEFEAHLPLSIEELPAAASMEVHPPSSLEEFPTAVAQPAASMQPVDVDDANYLSSFPIGYRFEPYDHELIIYYLKPKIAGEKLPPNPIHDINLYQYSPQQLAENHQPVNEDEWYFFTPRDKKYKGGKRPNRSAGDGYWKASGADTAVMYRGQRIGSRKTLVFQKGEHKHSERSDWTMYEYVVPDSTPKMEKSVGSSDKKLNDWVLCKISGKSKNGTSKRHRHKGSTSNNPLAAVPETNGEGDPNSPVEIQSSSGQGTISLTEGQSNVEQDNSALIGIQSHTGQRDSGPTQRQNIFVQGIRSPMAGERKGKGILMKGSESHGGQRDNGPMEGQNAFMQGIRSSMIRQRRDKGILIEDQSHDGQRDNGPMEGQNVFIQGISSPMAGQGNGILMEVQSHGGQRDSGPIEGQNVFIQGISGPVAGQNNVGQGNGLLMEVQNHGGRRDNGPVEGQNIFYQGIGRPMASQNNLWHETIMNPVYYGQVNSLDYPFSQLGLQFPINYAQTIPTHPNLLISHHRTQQIHESNGLSRFNQAHQNPQFTPQVPHQHDNQVLNWQAQSHNIGEFYAPQIHQPIQQLVSNDLTQQFHSNNPNYDMISYREPQNDINGILSRSSGNFGELEGLQCNYTLDNAFFDQLIEEIFCSKGNSSNNNGNSNHSSNGDINSDEAGP